jgi:tetratricopeptide (TPR) repeat protein
MFHEFAEGHTAQNSEQVIRGDWTVVRSDRVSFCRLGDLHRAEQALAAANSLNPRDPRVWAQLALVCLWEGGREEEAAFALREALKNELRDGRLLAEVGEKCLHRDLCR